MGSTLTSYGLINLFVLKATRCNLTQILYQQQHNNIPPCANSYLIRLGRLAKVIDKRKSKLKSGE